MKNAYRYNVVASTMFDLNAELGRRRLVAGGMWLLAILSAVAFTSTTVLSAEVEGQLSEDGKTRWYNVRDLGVEGQGWTDTKAPFDRLPGKAEGVVRAPVWSLSRHSAGLCVPFQTDASQLHVRWKLTSGSLAMPHMAATGVSGVDLYVRDPERNPDEWKWLAVGMPRQQENEARLFAGLPSRTRQYLLYLPLYNGTAEMQLGVPADSTVSQLERSPERSRPIVFYGTSITQGGCASRTGMVHTAILGRRLDRPVINLGFSGNGRMEIELAELLAELDAAVFVIDCLPNIRAEEVASRTEPLVRRLREAHPRTPIVLAEDRTYSNAFLLETSRERNDSSRAALREAFEKLQAEGVPELYYLPGENQLGQDNLGTVDGSHPTDLGFLRMADAFEPVLRPLLEKEGGAETRGQSGPR